MLCRCCPAGIRAWFGRAPEGDAAGKGEQASLLDSQGEEDEDEAEQGRQGRGLHGGAFPLRGADEPADMLTEDQIRDLVDSQVQPRDDAGAASARSRRALTSPAPDPSSGPWLTWMRTSSRRTP